MWEPYTERARRSIVLAQEEAMRMGNNYIDTEHMMLGIIAEGESIAGKYMEAKGLTLRQARFEVESVVGPGPQVVLQETVFKPRLKKVFETAYQTSNDIGDNYVGTEHILLALVRESEGVAGAIFKKFGFEPNTVKKDLFKLLAKSVTQPKQENPKVTKQQLLLAAAALPLSGILGVSGMTPFAVAKAMFTAAGFDITSD